MGGRKGSSLHEAPGVQIATQGGGQAIIWPCFLSFTLAGCSGQGHGEVCAFLGALREIGPPFPLDPPFGVMHLHTRPSSQYFKIRLGSPWPVRPHSLLTPTQALPPLDSNDHV